MKYKLLIICLLILLLLSFSKALASSVPAKGSKIAQVKSSPTFERISMCESGGDTHVKNKWSSASGEFQFIWNTWYHYGLEYWGDDFYEKNIWSSDNRELAWYIYTKYGTKDWEASRKCWAIPEVET